MDIFTTHWFKLENGLAKFIRKMEIECKLDELDKRRGESTLKCMVKRMEKREKRTMSLREYYSH
jgi:hypothetical protein